MEKKPAESLLIGAHTSAAGGAYHALLEGVEIGATTVQLFTANQKQWKGKPLTEEAIEAFQRTLQDTQLKKIMSHASYLINLASPQAEGLAKSREAFAQEIERCLALGITFLNFHPGAALDGSREEGLARIIESLLLMEELLEDGELMLLLETTAGQGSSLGGTFEELATIFHAVRHKIPVGICIDTCHIFAMGYDIRDKAGWEQALATFERLIGVKNLQAFHLNDSEKELGSRRDRHASLGMGKIGIDCFKYLMQNHLTQEIPKYLETPEGCPVWEKEIALLRKFASEGLCARR